MGEEKREMEAKETTSKIRPINTKVKSQAIPESEQQSSVRPISYEELKTMVSQYEQRYQKLAQENYMLRNEQALIRINFLFEVVKNREAFSATIYSRAAQEIEQSLYPSPQTEG